jgi:hypothetical protein
MNKGSKALLDSLRFVVPVFILIVLFAYSNCSGGNSQSGKVGSTNETVLGNPLKIAELPRVYLNSNYPTIPPGSVTWTVGNGKKFSDCQPAIDAANPGDIISVDAGFVCSPITLIFKNNPNGYYIVIQTANLNLLPPQGTRIGSSDEANLAIIETDSTTPAVVAAPQSNYYQLVGVEARVNASISLPTKVPIVVLGPSSITDLASAPNNIVIARSYVHGMPNQDNYVGIEFNGTAISVVDSMITEIHSLIAQGRGITVAATGSGPFKVDNDEIESGGSAFALTTSSPIVGMIPSDIEFQFNYLHRNPKWQTTSVTTTNNVSGFWKVQDVVSMVNAQRILINGNQIENIFNQGGADSFVLVLHPTSSVLGQVAVGTYYWNRVQDITFTNNLINSIPGFANIYMEDPQYPAVATLRVDIENNLAYGIGLPSAGSDPGIISLQGQSQGPVGFNHNTFLDIAEGGPTLLLAHSGGSFGQFIFINNLINDEGNGIYDPALGTGAPTLNADFPGIVFLGNVLAGQNQASYTGYTQGNFFPANLTAVGFLVDPTNGVTNYQNLGLSPQSPYVNGATDGTNPGVNISALP